MTDKHNGRHIFDSDYEPAQPSQVIFSILERAIREKNFVVNGSIIAYNDDIANEIDEYIKRLLSNIGNK